MTPHEQPFARCAAAIRAALAEAPERRAEDAALYLAHVEGSASLRRLAAEAGKPTTSVHRAIQRVEALRDDPLIDRAFDALGDIARRFLTAAVFVASDEDHSMAEPARPIEQGGDAPSEYALRIAERTLDRLCEPEAFMMVAKGAERAGVFSRKNRFRRPIALLTVEAAAELAARDWVRCVSRTAVSAKYAVSDAGRSWLRRRRAAVEAAQDVDSADGAPSPFAVQHRADGARTVAKAVGAPEVIRVNLGESPLGWLATRRGADGAPFLTAEEVEAGERLRNDFEAAQIGPRVTQDWRNFLTPSDGPGQARGPAEGPTIARDRVSCALADLGPGLADVALRACCFLEGLEATERRMGWSARSGKVVLKIALQRLALHYGLSRS